MIKRLPLILFILTLASAAFMILIRIAGSGVRLLSAKTGTGRFVAANYHSCIVVFIVILCAFIAVTIVVNRKRKKNRVSIEETAADIPEETQEDPDGKG